MLGSSDRVSIKLEFDTAEAKQSMQGVAPVWRETVDQMETDTEQLTESSEDFTGSIGNLKSAIIGLGAVWAAQKAVGFASDLFEMAKVQANAEKRLGAAIRATGGAAGFSAEQMKYYAEQLQSTTTFGDEAIIGAQALLTTFDKISGETFLRATQATLDLSAALQTDLNSAAMMVGKALQDPTEGITALRRAGITFTDAQQDQVKLLVETNRLMEAQSYILDTLSSKIGGTAEAMASDSFGQFEQLMGRLADFGESFATGIASGIGDISSAASKSITGMETDSAGMWASINQLASSTFKSITTGMASMAAESGIFGQTFKENMRVAFAEALASYEQEMNKRAGIIMFDKAGKLAAGLQAGATSDEDKATSMAKSVDSVIDQRLNDIINKFNQRMRGQ